MSKGVFDQNLSEMIELDRGLDINEVLASIPAIDDDTKADEEKPDETKKKSDDKSLGNINTILEKQAADIEEDKKKVEAVTKEDIDDNKSPAPNEQTPVETTSDSSFTVIFAKDLVKQGLLSSFDEKEFTEESKTLGEATALRNLIKNEIDANIEVAKSDLDLGYQEYLSLVGKGVQAETAGNLLDLKHRFEAIKVDELEKEENVDLRKSVLIDYYKLTTSMTDAKINKVVQSAIDLGDDLDDSKEFLSNLKSLIGSQIAEEEAEAKRQSDMRKEENRRTMESLRDTVNTVDEIIPGVGINKQTKVKMYEILTKEVQDSKGRPTNALWAKRAEDPIYFDSRLAYLLETGFFEKGKAWTKASQSRTTKEISELEKVLSDKKNTGTRSGAPVILNTVEEEKSVKSNIDSMRGVFSR